MAELIEILRKKLLYRSLNRGCRETDILLGSFARQELLKLSAAELEEFERFLDEYDGDIYKWLTGTAKLPAEYETSLGKKLLEFKYS
jgi:antitoxin CptB